jgi:general secretion pathway protein F
MGYTVLGEGRLMPWSAKGGAPARAFFPRSGKGQGRSQGRAGSFELLVFLQQLHDLLAAGLSLSECLPPLRQGVPAAQEAALRSLEASLQAGQCLSDAMAAEPARYPALLVALVRAAERTSELPEALARYLTHERRMAELRHRISSVAVYPVVLLAVGQG